MGSIYIKHPISLLYRIGTLLPALYITFHFECPHETKWSKYFSFAYLSLIPIIIVAYTYMLIAYGSMTSLHHEVNWLIYYWVLFKYMVPVYLSYQFVKNER